MPIKINGATSGSTTITAPDTGSDESIELSTALASKLDLAGGKILQIVRATKTGNESTTSSTFVDANFSVTITPQLNTSAVLLMADVYVQSTPASGTVTGHRLQITDSSNNAISGAQDHGFYGATAAGSVFVTTSAVWAYATPATTSATTYKLRFSRGNSVTTTEILNGTRKTGQMYAIEVSA